MSRSPAASARRYCELGLALTPLEAGTKVPKRPAWQDPANTIRGPGAAYRYWSAHPGEGLGAVLAPSGLCSLDVDHVELAWEILAPFGINLDKLRASAPTIIGNPARCRLEYRLPAGIELKKRTARWPVKDKPEKHFVILELRAGPVQDVLPPSLHPVHGHYTWAIPPVNGFPELPRRLLDLWLDWEHTNTEVLGLCPWYVPPEMSPKRCPSGRPADTPSVITAFNQAHDVASILSAHGYTRQGKRFLSPSSTTKVPGVVLLNDGRCYCHNESDALADGHAHDAFDLYVQFEHDGDVRRAAREAAKWLGVHPSIRIAT